MISNSHQKTIKIKTYTGRLHVYSSMGRRRRRRWYTSQLTKITVVDCNWLLRRGGGRSGHRVRVSTMSKKSKEKIHFLIKRESTNQKNVHLNIHHDYSSLLFLNFKLHLTNFIIFRTIRCNLTGDLIGFDQFFIFSDFSSNYLLFIITKCSQIYPPKAYGKYLNCNDHRKEACILKSDPVP